VVRPPDPEAPSGALTRVTIGVALLVAGGLLLWDRFVADLPGSADGGAGTLVTAVACGVVALGIVAAGLLGRRSGGLAPIAVVLAVSAVAGVVLRGPLGGVGDRTWSPGTVSQAEEGFDLGVGTARLDLTAPALTTGATPGDPVEVEARVGIGRLVVVVPEGASTEVQASTGIGAVTEAVPDGGTGGGPDGDTSGARGDTVVRVGTGEPVLVVSAEVGIGNVDVVERGGRS
jgi:hypothetical protein